MELSDVNLYDFEKYYRNRCNGQCDGCKYGIGKGCVGDILSPQHPNLATLIDDYERKIEDE